eukprot:COSAG02_NODE_41254_length_396_cov_1.205387_1_plen_71_part_10
MQLEPGVEPSQALTAKFCIFASRISGSLLSHTVCAIKVPCPGGSVTKSVAFAWQVFGSAGGQHTDVVSGAE